MKRVHRPRISSFAGAAAAVMLVSCGPAAPDNRTAATGTEQPAPALPSVPRPQAPLGRQELLAAIAQAASARAAGLDDAVAQRILDGRQFELRIRFGCRGPAQELRDRPLGWAYDREAGTLRVRAMPTISADDPTIARLAIPAVEAVEGFWVPRPWLLEPVCPAAAAVSGVPAEPPTDGEEQPGSGAQELPSPAQPRIGIAQFFTSADPRTGRRSERAYEAVKTLEADQPIGSQGFNLVLAGRLRALPGRRVIHCVAKGAEQPPDCVASAVFDRVWIEAPEDGAVFAEWRPR